MSNFKILFITCLFSCIFFTGCFVPPADSTITDIDSSVAQITSHLQQISSQNGKYRNEQLDFQLLQSVKNNLLKDLYLLDQKKQSGTINKDLYDKYLDKNLSALHFIWLEELENALSNNQDEYIAQINTELTQVNNYRYVQDWIKNNNKQTAYDNIKSLLRDLIELTNLNKTITENNIKLAEQSKQLEELKQASDFTAYNQLAKEYNQLVESNSALINTYNQSAQKYDSLYLNQVFLEYININQILPDQYQLNLK